MIAFFVHNFETDSDVIVLPEMGCSLAVDRNTLEAFISPSPNFAEWSGDACSNVAAEDFGTVAATRDDQGDVNVVNEELWRRRMDFHMTRAR